MPVYEYRCTQCKKVFEYQQRMADAPKTVCEACQGDLERLISRSSFALKGDGWYKDLYSSSKPSSTEASPTSTESKPTSTESKPTSTESKPSGSGSEGAS